MDAQNANVGSYKTEGFVEVLAASQTPRSTEWFQGTADAVRQYIWLFEEAMRNGVEDLLILSGMLAPPFAPPLRLIQFISRDRRGDG